MAKCWTEEENEYMRKHYGKTPREEIARVLNRTIPALNNQAKKLGLREKTPVWTPEEEQFLRENWHSVSIGVIAEKLGRTETSIKTKQKRMKLGPQIHPGMFVLRDICNLLGMDHRRIKRYIKAGYLRAKKAPLRGRSVMLIHPANLRKFLRNHPDAWDARVVDITEVMRQIREKERTIEAVEAQKENGGCKDIEDRRIPEHLRPVFARFVADVALKASDRIVKARQEQKLTLEWFQKKAKEDMAKERECLRWTPKEDERLRKMFQSGRYTYQEMADRLGRTRAAISQRIRRIEIWNTEEAI
jgi:hypothetical protein